MAINAIGERVPALGGSQARDEGASTSVRPTHTRVHTHMHTFPHSHSLSVYLSVGLPLSLSLSHFRSRIHTHSYALTLTRTHTLTLPSASMRAYIHSFLGDRLPREVAGASPAKESRDSPAAGDGVRPSGSPVTLVPGVAETYDGEAALVPVSARNVSEVVGEEVRAPPSPRPHAHTPSPSHAAAGGRRLPRPPPPRLRAQRQHGALHQAGGTPPPGPGAPGAAAFPGWGWPPPVDTVSLYRDRALAWCTWT